MRMLTAYRGELDIEEDGSDIEDPIQDLANEDVDGIQRGA